LRRCFGRGSPGGAEKTVRELNAETTGRGEEEARRWRVGTVLQLGDPGLREIAKQVDDPAAPAIRMLADDLADRCDSLADDDGIRAGHRCAATIGANAARGISEMGRGKAVGCW